MCQTALRSAEQRAGLVREAGGVPAAGGRGGGRGARGCGVAQPGAGQGVGEGWGVMGMG